MGYWKFWAGIVAWTLAWAVLLSACMGMLTPMLKALPAVAGKVAAEVSTAYEKEKANRGQE